LLADPERGHKLFIKPLKLIEVMKWEYGFQLSVEGLPGRKKFFFF
jgi:hypothetical protein